MGLYLTVLSVSLLVAATGLTLIAVQRSERQLQNNIVRTEEVRWCARAGIEQALLFMEQTADWRSRVAGNKLIDGLTVGNGSVTVEVYDDLDGNLTNNNAQPVRLVSKASRQGAVCKLSVQLQARPHRALNFALFCPNSDDLEFKATTSCRGPVRSHGKIKSAAGVTLADDASFETITGYTIDNPLTPKLYATAALPEPQPNLAFYTAMATTIYGEYGAECILRGHNLTPTSNPQGAPNASGIYVLDAAARKVRIENFHLRGTLIITNTGGNAVELERGVWIEPGPLGYPVLLIDAPGQDVAIHPDSSLNELGISLIVPLNGSNITLSIGVDYDESGGLPVGSVASQVRGVIWSNGRSLTLASGAWPFIGSAISRRIIVDNTVRVDNDLTLLYTPLPGFVESGMNLVQGSFVEVP